MWLALLPRVHMQILAGLYMVYSSPRVNYPANQDASILIDRKFSLILSLFVFYKNNLLSFLYCDSFFFLTYILKLNTHNPSFRAFMQNFTPSGYLSL